MSEWIKYDGSNPPTDRTKDVRWMINPQRNWYVTCYAGHANAIPSGASAWQYLDPFFAPEPETPDVVWISGWNLPDGEGHWVREEIIPGSGRTRYRRCVEKRIGRFNGAWQCECGASWISRHGAICPACGAEVKR